jgi:hypothetical protein
MPQPAAYQVLTHAAVQLYAAYVQLYLTAALAFKIATAALLLHEVHVVSTNSHINHHTIHVLLNLVVLVPGNNTCAKFSRSIQLYWAVANAVDSTE